MEFFFATDLHGKITRYENLFRAVLQNTPDVLLLGGDLLPHGMHRGNYEDFIDDFFLKNFAELKKKLGQKYPEVMLILGNDDARADEETFIKYSQAGYWHYIHKKKVSFEKWNIYGYSYVPPTPFRYKDWERFDVSRYVDPGCISPLEGIHTVDTGEDLEYGTIEKDLAALTGDDNLENAIFLFHSPPYKTFLDRAALDGMTVDHVPLDVHVGSIAIKNIIEQRQPQITLHGHIHESTRITGHWRQTFGRTHSFNGSWDGPELCIIKFDPDHPENAVRELL